MTFYSSTVQIAYPYDRNDLSFRTVAKMSQFVKSDPPLTNAEWKNITWPQQHIGDMYSVIAEKLKQDIEQQIKDLEKPERKTPLMEEIEKNTTYEIVDTGIKYTFKKRDDTDSKDSDKSQSGHWLVYNRLLAAFLEK